MCRDRKANRSHGHDRAPAGTRGPATAGRGVSESATRENHFSKHPGMKGVALGKNNKEKKITQLYVVDTVCSMTVVYRELLIVLGV